MPRSTIGGLFGSNTLAVRAAGLPAGALARPAARLACAVQGRPGPPSLRRPRLRPASAALQK
eukprot:5787011-Pyramimonas_sp.AAC.1